MRLRRFPWTRDQFLREICKLHSFEKCNACDLRAAMYASLWLNIVAAVQMFLIERIFAFFMTSFLKKMGIILSASKPQCHSRLSKPILEIISLNTFSDCSMHQNFKYFLQNWIWWSKLSNCSQMFYEKDALIRFNNVSPL